MPFFQGAGPQPYAGRNETRPWVRVSKGISKHRSEHCHRRCEICWNGTLTYHQNSPGEENKAAEKKRKKTPSTSLGPFAQTLRPQNKHRHAATAHHVDWIFSVQRNGCNLTFFSIFVGAFRIVVVLVLAEDAGGNDFHHVELRLEEREHEHPARGGREGGRGKKRNTPPESGEISNTHSRGES